MESTPGEGHGGYTVENMQQRATKLFWPMREESHKNILQYTGLFTAV